MQALPIILFVVRVFIGGFFLYAAVPKIADPLAFATSISHYHLLPNWAVNGTALILPWLELLTGTALLLGFKTRTSAALCGAMLVVFTIAVAYAVIQGLQIDCGCFGDQGGEEVSWLKVAKNTAMIAGCVLLLLKPVTFLSIDERFSKPA
ncbi:MAG: MauE/DoxX family redox-associated membrane protein [Candidatus Kapaibacterium sp.]|nr:MAG: MauE/DoxX family redox-associated membrane protein [Candidatus Kapabacteria bacterium]